MATDQVVYPDLEVGLPADDGEAGKHVRILTNDCIIDLKIQDIKCMNTTGTIFTRSGHKITVSQDIVSKLLAYLNAK